MTRLILADTRVADIIDIIGSMLPDTDLIPFDFFEDTFDSIKSKITKQYDSVCIAQHNYMANTVKFLNSMPDATILNVEQNDPLLLSWAPVVDLFYWMKSERSVQYIDLLACNIWANDDWRYVITKLREVSDVYIRASVNITGAGGDFILESDNVDLVGIYFTENILNYKYQFYYLPTSLADPSVSFNKPVQLTSGGYFSATAYSTFIGTKMNLSTGVSGATYINPIDVSNVVYAVSTANNASTALLTASGKVVAFGNSLYGGDISSISANLLDGVTKIVSCSQSFAALKSNGTVYTWGCINGISVDTTTDPNIVPPSSVDLSGCIDIFSSKDVYVALKSDRTVVRWGNCKTWPSVVSQLYGIISIKEMNGVGGYPSFAALRNDSMLIMWGVSGIVSSAALTSNSPIVDYYPVAATCVIIRGDGTVYKGISNTARTTIPAGKKILAVYPIYTAYSDFAIHYDDYSLYLSDINNTITARVSQFINNAASYAYIKNGAVYTVGDTRYGGSTTDATNGIKNGVSVSGGVVKLASTSNSMVAIKSDGSITAWGSGRGGWADLSGVQSLLFGGAITTVDVVDLYNGYIAFTSDNRMVTWGDTTWYNTTSTGLVSNVSIPTGNTSYVFPAVSSPIILDMSKNITQSVSSVTRYSIFDVSFTTNVQSCAIRNNHSYALYLGASVLGYHVPSEPYTPWTYTFEKIAFSLGGIQTCSIVDITDISYTVFSINITSSTSGINPLPTSYPIIAQMKDYSNAYCNAVVDAPYNDTTIQTITTSFINTFNRYFFPVCTSFTISSPAQLATFSALSNITRIELNSTADTVYLTDVSRNQIMFVKATNGVWAASPDASNITIVSGVNGMGLSKTGVIATVCASGCMARKSLTDTNYSIDLSGRLMDDIAISGAGDRIVTVSGGLYYSIANDITPRTVKFHNLLPTRITDAKSCVAMSQDGFAIAYATSSGQIKYSFYTGNDYSVGRDISGLTQQPLALKFSDDGKILICTCVTDATNSIFYTYWNGYNYVNWKKANIKIGAVGSKPTGLAIDSAGKQLYITVQNSNILYRLPYSFTTKNISYDRWVRFTGSYVYLTNNTMVFRLINLRGANIVAPSTCSITSVVPSAGNTLTVDWTHSEGTNTYLVYYSLEASGNLSGTAPSILSSSITNKLNNDEPKRFVIPNVSGGNYAIRIRVVNMYNESTSNYYYVSLYDEPETPTVSSITFSDGNATVYWDSSTNGIPVSQVIYSLSGTQLFAGNNFNTIAIPDASYLNVNTIAGVSLSTPATDVGGTSNVYYYLAKGGTKMTNYVPPPSGNKYLSIKNSGKSLMTNVDMSFAMAETGYYTFYFYSNLSSYIPVDSLLYLGVSITNTDTSVIITDIKYDVNTSQGWKLYNVGFYIPTTGNYRVRFTPSTSSDMNTLNIQNTVWFSLCDIYLVNSSGSTSTPALTNSSFTDTEVSNNTASIITDTLSGWTPDNKNTTLSLCRGTTEYSGGIAPPTEMVQYLGFYLNSTEAAYPSATGFPYSQCSSIYQPINIQYGTYYLKCSCVFVSPSPSRLVVSIIDGSNTEYTSLRWNVNTTPSTFTNYSVPYSISVSPDNIPDLTKQYYIKVAYWPYSGGTAAYYCAISNITMSFIPRATTSKPLQISGLSTIATTNVSLRTINNVGISSAKSINISSSPVITSITSPTSSSLIVNWSLSTSSGNTVNAIYYSVEVSGNLSGNTPSLLASTTTSPLTITGLQQNTIYAVRMYAATTNGNTPNTEYSYFTTVGVPYGHTITSIANSNVVRRLDVNWSVANNGGKTITDVKYQIEPANNITGTSSLISVGSTNNPFYISNLSGGIMYAIRFKLTNSEGDSNYSIYYYQLPMDVPSTPLITRAEIGSSSTDVYWSDVSNGSNIVSLMYSDLSKNIMNGDFTDVSVEDGSFISVSTIPNWSQSKTNGSIYIGRGNTGVLTYDAPPTNTPQYVCLTSDSSNSITYIAQTVEFDLSGLYSVSFMAQFKGTTTVAAYSRPSKDFLTVGIYDLNNTLIYENIHYLTNLWRIYTSGFKIDSAGTYSIRLTYSSTNPTSPNYTSITNIHLVSSSNNTVSLINSGFTSNTVAENSTSGFRTITGWEQTFNTSSSISYFHIGRGINDTCAIQPPSDIQQYAVIGNSNTTATYVYLSLSQAFSMYPGTYNITFKAYKRLASVDNIAAGTGQTLCIYLQYNFYTYYTFLTIQENSWNTYSVNIDINDILKFGEGIHYGNLLDLTKYKLFILYTSTLDYANNICIGDIKMSYITPLIKTVSNPLQILKTYQNGRKLQLMTVNQAGSSQISMPKPAYKPPTITNTVSYSKNTITVQWSHESITTASSVYYSIALSGTTVAYPNTLASMSGDSFTISGLTEYTEYAISIRIIDSDGNYTPASSSVSARTIGVPGIPTLYATATEINKLNVYWTCDNHGSQLTNVKYQIEPQDNITGTTTIVSVGSVANPFVISGLIGGTTYAIRIITTNEIGDSSYSQYAYGLAYDIPSKPTITSITSPSKNTLNVYWIDSSNGADFTQLEYSIDGSTPTIVTTVANPIVLTNLVGGQMYDIKIQAWNKGGESIESSVYSAIASDIPGTPVITDVVYSNNNFKVHWTSLSNGAEITGIKYSTNGDTPTTHISASNPFTLPDLSNGLIYPIKLITTNTAGDSLVSNVYNLMTYIVNPAPITVYAPEITSVSSGNKYIAVNFTQSITGTNYPITYQYSLNDGSYMNADELVSPILITDLTNGTSYNVRIRSVYLSGGMSSPSNLSSSVIPHDIPDTPILKTATAYDSYIECEFIPGDANGGTVLYSYSINGGFTFEGSVSSTGTLQIPNLTNGIVYDVAIKAVSEYGNSGSSNVITGVIPYKLPDAPVIDNVSSSSTEAIISYIDASSNGYSILFYTYSINGSSYKPATSFTSPFIVGGLTPATEYTVKMKAVNSKGVSTESNAYSFTTQSNSNNANAPVIINATPDNGKIYIDFTPSVSGEILNYLICINGGTFIELNSSYIISSSKLLLTGLTNGISYDIAMQVQTAAGYSLVSNTYMGVIPYSAPDAPVINNVEVSSGKAVVSFTNSMQTGGYPIIQCKYSLNGIDYSYTPTPNSPFTIYNLTNGTTYTVSMKSITIKGTSVDSSSISFTPIDTPAKPIILDVSANNEYLIINMQDGDLNGGTKIGYKASIDGGSSFFDVSSSDISGTYITLRGLTNGVSYNVAIKTVTNNGSSPSSMVSYNNVPYTLPSPPTITYTAIDSNKVHVSFTAGNNGGYPITQYQYSLNGNDYIFTPTNSSPFTVYNLTNGTEYTITMRAVSLKGISVDSESSTFTPYNVPDSPIILDVSANDGYLIIRVQDGPLNGGIKTGYKASIDGGYSFFDVSSSDINGSYITLRELINGVSYNIAIKTVSNNGVSSSSFIAYNKIPYTIPYEPVITNIDISNSTVSIHINESISNGYPILGYKYSFDNVHYYYVSNSTNGIITFNLTNGEYTIRLKAFTQVDESLPTFPETFTVSYTPSSTGGTTNTSGIPNKPIIINVAAGNQVAHLSVVDGELNNGVFVKYQYKLNDGLFQDVQPSDVNNGVITIHNLENATTYNISILTVAENGNSSASNIVSVMPFTVPDAPTITNVIAGDRICKVEFTPSTTNGVPVINYQYSTDGTNYRWCSTIEDNSFIIHNLINGESYTLIMRAVSIEGNSANSNQSSSFTPYGFPNTPSITNVLLGNQELTVYINNNESSVQGYKYSLNGASFVNSSNTTSPIVIQGLTNGTPYTVVVKSVNSLGESDSSLPYIQLIPRDIPNKPIINTITAKNQMALVDMSNTSLNGDVILKYSYSFDQNTWYDAIPNAKDMYSFAITGLTNGTAYSIYVKIVGNSGSSLASNVSSSFTPITVPNAPTNIFASAFDRYISVSFTAPNDGYSPIIQYLYSVNGANYIPTNTSDTTINIYGVLNGTSYTVKIKAQNAAGYSEESALSNAVVPSSVPTVPTITKILPGNNCLYVYYTAPDINTLTKIQYSIGYSSSYPQGTKWEDVSGGGLTSPFTIYGLNNKDIPITAIRSVNISGYSPVSNVINDTSYVIRVGSPQPAIITSVIPMNRQVRVNFNMPLITNSAILSINGIHDKTNTLQKLVWTPDMSYVIFPNLTNGTSYSIKLQLINQHGYSLYSNDMSCIPMGPPNALLIYSVLRTGLNSVKISSSIPFANGSPVTKYYYTYRTSSQTYPTLVEISSNNVIISSNKIDFLIGNMPTNTGLMFNIYSENSNGISLKSNLSVAYILSYMPPSKINENTISVITALGQATVSFTLPKIDQYTSITGYKYTLLEMSGNTGIELPEVETTNAYPLVASIKNNTQYYIKIRSRNEAGWSSNSELDYSYNRYPFSYQYLPPTAPRIRSIVQTTGVGSSNTTATLSFTISPSVSRNCDISGYFYISNVNNVLSYIPMTYSSNSGNYKVYTVVVPRDPNVSSITSFTTNSLTNIRIVANSILGYSEPSLPYIFKIK